MKGIIDLQSNPFARESWIQQGFSLTPERRKLVPNLFKRTVEQIRFYKVENESLYPAFLAVRWGFAFLRNGVLFPTYKWNHKESYDGFGEPISGFKISETTARWENEFNIMIFDTYDQAKVLGYRPTYFLRKIRKDGGMISAKYWLTPRFGSESKGFIRLKEMGRLGISLEAIVLRYPFYNLFLKEELDIARSKLIRAGFNVSELYDQPEFGQVTEEIHDSALYPEGAKHQVTVNAYERNPEARRKCIAYYGPTCVVCHFNFDDFYGEEFKDYIHVHHLTPLAEVRNEYVVDPINELRPVCPNCHAVIHRKTPPYTIEQAIGFVKNLKKIHST